MKKLSSLLVLIFLFSVSGAFAQDSQGSQEMNRLLSKNLKYPAELRQSNTQGIVVVSIQIDQKGYISDFGHLSGNAGFEDEINRTMSILKENWKPSFLEGKSFDEEYLMSFDFRISKSGEFSPKKVASTTVSSAQTDALEAVNLALVESPFSPKLYSNRAELLEEKGQQLLAEMDLNQARFLKSKMLTEVVIVGYVAEGAKSL